MSQTPSERYAALVARGEIAFDAAQEALAERLSRLAIELENRRLAHKTSHLGWLFARRHHATPVRGLYIYGEVGRGKTMLVDMFFEAVSVRRKRRAHFADFMADVHERVHRTRQRIAAGALKGDDPIPPVAAEIADETRLLCLDEFHVDDITDAMILGRLFTRLFDRGLVLVTTSNTAPDDLYAGGLNRALFLPFVALLKERTAVVCLDARTDYRLGRLAGGEVYFTPADAAARAAMDRAWAAVTDARPGSPMELEVKGRKVAVPLAVRGAARFSFADLCRQPLGSSDYLKIARTFRTVFIDGVPMMGPADRNAARRFVLLIDALYDQRVKLVMSADAEPDALNTSGDAAVEFRRTASRLYEMRSQDYLAAPHGAQGPESVAPAEVSVL
ncbi:cell division protein ZapE [Tepidamorphus gemmatus]|uniref:Cell division protein ZapE n=1 Tax=Tepidamorphus gemmatus TaxID=747076 RepID=A0A4R3LYQ5_9HYPH|nr:cell division protein ZapE [Tepidamorphus gemmatus]TCT05851.1 cell division protein ZapE [Tepidamorphus gemmatus]